MVMTYRLRTTALNKENMLGHMVVNYQLMLEDPL